MKAFADLFENLDQTTKTNQKVAALVSFFEVAEDQDKVWAIALLSHKRPKRTVNTTRLKEWSAEVSHIPFWLFDETYHIVGDLAETITMLTSNELKSDKGLTYWVRSIIELQDATEDQKKEFILSAWNQLDRNQRFVFNKIITGGFRVGVSKKIVIKGLSKATGIDESTMAFNLMGDWNPDEVSYEALVFADVEQASKSKPYPFCLAYALDIDFDQLGSPALWQAEYKWDGIRGQIVKREGELFVWSRGEELMTEKFPEFQHLVDVIPDGVVIDGEIVTYRNGKVLPFSLLQTRIGRKNISKKTLEDAPVSMIAYDLLEYEGNDFRSEPLSKRRSALESVISFAKTEILVLSGIVPFDNWDELAQIRENSRSVEAEGLMLKALDSPYHDGRKRGDWWKWKIDPFTIDAVLTYAMRGHGRRSGLYTDYTFGLWHEGELITFAKAYSGLTDEEFRQVDSFVKRNTLERFGPVRMVEPKLVFELAFEGISESSRHKSGYAVRFPRIHRWRKDKDPKEANDLKDLQHLLNH